MGKKKNVTKKNEESDNLQTELESLDQQKRAATRSITNLLNKFTLTEKQKELLKIINDNKIIIIKGPCGTSKTFLTCYYITELIAKHSTDFKQFILTKPIQESGEKLGFLPGDVAEKIGPYFESYVSHFERMMPPLEFKKLLEKKKICYEPIAYLRGRDFSNSILICDESQNCDISQLVLFTTRMGKGSKVIIMGDTSQYDVRSDVSGLSTFADLIQNVDKVAVFEFGREDILRDPILIEITDLYEIAKYGGKLPNNKFGN